MCAGVYEAVHLEEAQLQALRLLVSQLEAAPALVHAPELDFFRRYLGGLGAVLPPPIEEQARPAAPCARRVRLLGGV